MVPARTAAGWGWPVGAMLLLAALVLTSIVQTADAVEVNKSLQKPVQEQYAHIYANGSFFGNWRDNSVGCLRCNFEDVQRRRNTSTASLSAVVQPWGALTLSSSSVEPSDSVLDFWVKGSGLTAISLYIKDSATMTMSKDVRFQRADQLPRGVNILGNDEDGFIHVQVALATLLTTGINGSSPAADKCGARVMAHFDRIVFADISGMGFNLVLDDIKLVNQDVISASSFLLPITSKKAPVFGDDLTALKAGKNRYVMKLKPDAAWEDINTICQELAGRVTQPRRFNGLCNTPLSTLLGKRNTSSGNGLAWGLVTFTVQSPRDLDAMRTALADRIEYFEADLTGFTTIRQLHEAVKAGKGFNISSNSVEEDPSMPAERPCWARSDSCEPAAGSVPDWVTRSKEEDQPPAGRSFSSIQTTTTPTAQRSPLPSPRISPAPAIPLSANATGNLTGNSTVDSIGGFEVLMSKSNSSAMDLHDGVPADPTASVPAQVDVAEMQASTQSVSSWGLDRINQESLPLDDYYSSGDFDGRGVHVYVLDTGVRATHYDFKGRIGDGAAAVGGSAADDNGHGSHVSGTVLGSIHGVAPSAILHPVKVMDAQGNGAYSNIIAGIQWVKDHKTRNNIASAILSMSIAGPRSAALNDAVEAAVAAGITVVTAAGNNKGGDSCSMSPASAPSAITVGASTDTDALASMSNIGTCLSLFAPGVYIASASWQSDTGESYMSGTSMATPHVAGAAALYLQLRPGAPPAEVKAALKYAAVQTYFESSSPQLLLNVMSARLRAAQRALAPQPSSPPVTPPTSTPTPSTSPKPATPKPSPSPTPRISPSPTPPTHPAPNPPPVPIPAFPSFPINPTMPTSICATCKWCMFC